MSFLLKVHKGVEGNIVAVCDHKILGKTFNENNKLLEIKKSFYSGRPAKIDEIIKEINESISTNIIGNEITKELIIKSILKEENVLEIDGIKYAFIFKV